MYPARNQPLAVSKPKFIQRSPQSTQRAQGKKTLVLTPSRINPREGGILRLSSVSRFASTDTLTLWRVGCSPSEPGCSAEGSIPLSGITPSERLKLIVKERSTSRLPLGARLESSKAEQVPQFST